MARARHCLGDMRKREDDLSKWQKNISMAVQLSAQGSIFSRWPEVCDISSEPGSELFSFAVRQKQLWNDYCPHCDDKMLLSKRPKIRRLQRSETSKN